MSREGIIIGFHAVEELLNSDVTIGKVYVNNQADKQKIGVLRQLASLMGDRNPFLSLRRCFSREQSRL